MQAELDSIGVIADDEDDIINVKKVEVDDNDQLTNSLQKPQKSGQIVPGNALEAEFKALEDKETKGAASYTTSM